MNLSTLVNNITSTIQNKMSIPLVPIPPILTAYGTIQRPGISPMLISSRIISRQADFGAPTGNNIDGNPNLMNQLIYAIVEELVYALKQEGKVEVSIPIGGIVTTGTGSNAGGPVVVTSNNIIPVSGNGIIR